MTKSGIVPVLCLSIFLLCSCTMASDEQQLLSVKSISDNMKYLTSDICDGRALGTTGNEKAAQYIANRMELLGLLPLADKWGIPYDTTVEHVIPDKLNLSVISNQDTEMKLTYGTDYWEAILAPGTIDLPLVRTPSNEVCALLTDMSDGDIPKISDPLVKMILTNNRSASKRFIPVQSSDKTILHISNDTFEKLMNMKDARVKFSGSMVSETKTINNVGSMILGEDRTRLLVIGAHFDHLGGVPTESSRLVWRGALDNASGVAAMLAIAEETKRALSGNKPACDIAFAAFNSEESDRSGSRNFAQFLENKYKQVVLINLDCIGQKDVDSLQIFTNETSSSRSLAEYINKNWVEKKNPPNVQQGTMLSDHASFSSSLSLTSFSDESSNTDRAHTLEDTLDRVDMNLLAVQTNQVSSLMLHAVADAGFWELCPEKEHNDTVIIKEEGTEIKGQRLSEFEKQFNIQTHLENNEDSVVYLTARVSYQVGDGKSISSKSIIDISKITSLSGISRMVFSLAGNPYFMSFVSYRKDIPMELQIRTWEYDSNEGASDKIATIMKNGSKWTFYQRKEDGPLAVLGMESDQVDVRCIISRTPKEVLSSEEDCKKWLDSLPISFIENMMSQVLISNKSN